MLTPLSESATPPLSLYEVKDFLRVDHNDEDELISSMIEQAVELAEKATNRTLSARNWRFIGRRECIFSLPNPPFLSVESVEYLAEDGTRKAWADYRLELLGEATPARLVLLSTPGDLHSSARDLWHIDYTAGGATLPSGLRSALLLTVRRLYDERSGDDDKPILSKGIERLFKLYAIRNR